MWNRWHPARPPGSSAVLVPVTPVGPQPVRSRQPLERLQLMICSTTGIQPNGQLAAAPILSSPTVNLGASHFCLQLQNPRTTLHVGTWEVHHLARASIRVRVLPGTEATQHAQRAQRKHPCAQLEPDRG